jgi:hypothetical protein
LAEAIVMSMTIQCLFGAGLLVLGTPILLRLGPASAKVLLLLICSIVGLVLRGVERGGPDLDPARPLLLRANQRLRQVGLTEQTSALDVFLGAT